MRKRNVCWYCDKERERCRAVTSHIDGRIEWYCPQCYKELGIDQFIKGGGESNDEDYKDKQEAGKEDG